MLGRNVGVAGRVGWGVTVGMNAVGVAVVCGEVINSVVVGISIVLVLVINNSAGETGPPQALSRLTRPKMLTIKKCRQRFGFVTTTSSPREKLNGIH